MPLAPCVSRHTVNLLAFLFLIGVALACVTGELRSVEAAQTKYDECVADYSVDDPACRKLHKDLQAAQQQYETKSRRAWNCDTLSEDCPTRY